MNITASGGQAEGSRGSIASWWHGRYGAQLMIEIAICAGLLVLYREIRTFNKADLQAAYSNSRDIIAFESWLGLPFEDNLQGWLLNHPVLIRGLNHYYIWAHFPMAIGFLLWMYLRHPDRYRPFRNLMAFVTFAALVLHLLFPLAPPRMMPHFVDTMSEFGPSIYPKNALDGAANQIAAMPSLHFGWAMIEAIAVVSVLRSRWRLLAILHPFLMALSIIATGNHWWIDAAAAAVLIVAAVAMWRVLTVWVGDRSWSWTAFRFQTREGVARLEALANSGAANGGAAATSDTNDPVTAGQMPQTAPVSDERVAAEPVD
jgi:hypothetical protein